MRYYQSSYNQFRTQPPKKPGFFSRLFRRSPKRPPSVSAGGVVGRFTNPYIRPKKKTFIFPFKTVGFGLLILAWLWCMVYLPYFRIVTTTFGGLRIIKQPEIAAVVDSYMAPSKFWPKNNYFIVSEDALRDLLMQKFSLHDVTIEKKFPNQLRVVVEEKISSIVYDNGVDYYLLDQGGLPFKHIGAGEGGEELFSTSTRDFPTTTSTPEHIPDLPFLSTDYADFPIVYDRRKPTITDGKPVVSSEFIAGLIEFYSAFKHAKLGTIKYGVVDEPAAGVTLVLDKKWRLRIQPTHDSRTQMENISVILKQEKPAEYIDVRFGDRVYWK